jgi:DNA polymerase III subunit epsilon
MDQSNRATAAPTSSPTFAVVDFETTGSSMAQGARATEVGIVLVRDGLIVDRYSSLMRSGAWVSPYIEQLTGISNAMLEEAPPSEQVMREASEFVRGCTMVAHNASFDRVFWRVERRLAGCETALSDDPDRFACTVLLSRRLYPEAPNHKLGTLTEYFALPTDGPAHRAGADAGVTAHLLIRMLRDIEQRFALELDEQPVGPEVLLALQCNGKGTKAALHNQHLSRLILSGVAAQRSTSAQQVGVS